MSGENEGSGEELVEHRTPKGLVSMDSSKWRVAQVTYATRPFLDTGLRGYQETRLWGIFPPMDSMPTQSCSLYADAITRAARYAYFKVVPPQQDSEIN